jgi:antitoxin HicB
MVGPLTIELSRKIPIFIGITPILESQLPMKLPRMQPLRCIPIWVSKSVPTERINEEVQAKAIKEVVAWQLAEAMKKKKISKVRMAALLKTSRTQVDRLLDPKNDITLSSLQRAAAIVGRRVSIELV